MNDPQTLDSTAATDRGLILVVEDDSFLRKLLVQRLQRERFSVQEANDGKEALACLSTRVPMLMLLDLMMPDVDGFQVLEQVRKNPKTKDLPVIVLSNVGEQQLVERVSQLGADDYLIKAHFVLDEIVERVTKVLSKRYL